MVKTICGEFGVSHSPRFKHSPRWAMRDVLQYQNRFNGLVIFERKIIIMPHSFVKIWIHAIWATKEREPLVKPAIEKNIHEYMRKEFVDMNCPVRIINGMPDHVHCLFLLSRENSIADIVKQIKGSSSHYVNEQNLITEKFAWQTGYAAYSVSESQLEKVYNYIKNQKAHHAKKSFHDEYNEFLKLYGFEGQE